VNPAATGVGAGASPAGLVAPPAGAPPAIGHVSGGAAASRPPGGLLYPVPTSRDTTRAPLAPAPGAAAVGPPVPPSGADSLRTPAADSLRAPAPSDTAGKRP
jgi:hypothetical protein